MDLAVPPWLQHSPATYSAWIAGIALLVTALAAAAALLQLRNALAVRREQARPSVVAFEQVSPRSDFVIDLVVKNFGTTAARNVEITSSPTLQRAANMTPGNTDVPLPLVPTLAPGQEWRTTWDFMTVRLAPDATHGLPDRHRVTVAFQDSKGVKLSTDSVLDFAAYRGRRHLGVKTVSDLAKSVAEIEKHLRAFTEGLGNHAGIRVWVRDGAEKDARDEAAWREIEEQDERHRRFLAAEQTRPAGHSEGDEIEPKPDGSSASA